MFAFGVPPDKVVTTGATAVFAAGVDAVGYGGAAWGLVLDSAARALDGGYGRRCTRQGTFWWLTWWASCRAATR